MVLPKCLRFCSEFYFAWNVSLLMHFAMPTLLKKITKIENTKITY